jgi:NhaA family Na+:H+ antiporter
MTRRKRHRVSSPLRQFLESEAAGGLVLMAAAAAAILIANTPLNEPYRHLLHAPIGPMLTPKLGPMSLHLWINDGLMAIFFLLIGLEIKREFVDGELSNPDARRLPVIAAASGMIFPALIYVAITTTQPGLTSGWAIPAATDIAFAIGVLSLLGSRAPATLKLFLTTVAIADDMGAVAIIAIAYTSSIDTLALGAAGGLLALMYVLNVIGSRRLVLYLPLAGLVWYFTLLSGVHATVAGVLAAATIPVRQSPGRLVRAPLHRLEHALSNWVAFLIVPIFGFANAGVRFIGLETADLFASLPLAIAAGLFFGKQVGIFGAILACARLGVCMQPRGSTWLQIYAVSILCGIGFTMSLFIAGLAFPDDPALVEEAKLGILLGSLVSAVTGFLILRFAPARVSGGAASDPSSSPPARPAAD